MTKKKKQKPKLAPNIRQQKPKLAPNIRQQKALKYYSENGGNWYRAILDAGFSDNYARSPSKLLATKSFDDLVDRFLPDYKLLATHTRQLTARRLDHMVFPLGPDSQPEQLDDEMGEDTIIASGESVDLTDEEITTMLAEANCIVRKIVHGEQARHVYFWSADNKAQLAAVDLAYKIKNKMPQAAKPGLIVPIQVNVNEDRKKYA